MNFELIDMKKIFALIVIIICSTLHSFSQDVIVLKNGGNRIQAKIVEVDEDDVKYKNWNSPDSSIISVNKADIDMILYVNGSKDVFIETVDSTSANTKKNKDTATATTKTVNNNKDTANTITTTSTTSATVKHSNDELFEQGQLDASAYYRGYKGASSVTFLVTVIGTPILGLIPALAFSLTPPGGKHLRCPDRELLNEHAYFIGYRMKAKKIKATRVWLSYGEGSTIWLIYALLYGAL
jgi:hypothetical protein